MDKTKLVSFEYEHLESRNQLRVKDHKGSGSCKREKFKFGFKLIDDLKKHNIYKNLIKLDFLLFKDMFDWEDRKYFSFSPFVFG